VTTVRFEELVQSPAEVLGQVCSRVGVEFDERMLDPEERRRDPVIASREYAHGRLSEPVDPARAGGGDRLPPWAASVVERYAGAGMARHGYGERAEELGSAARDVVAQELELLEPVLQERLAREQFRRSPRERRGTFEEPEAAGRAPKLEGLAKLAAAAERRRGDSVASTEVEALRALAAEAIERLEESRASEARVRRRLDAAKARIKALRDQTREGRKRPSKRRKKAAGAERKRGSSTKG
jgi:hypothetical protein